MSEIRNQRIIGVIGGANPDEKALKDAFTVGHLIGENNAILLCGGLSGVMEAAARGAKEAGGLTIGVLPGFSRSDANPFIDIPIVTGLGYSRNSLVAMNSDILIAIDGQFGTLSEIAYGRIYKKKIIGLNTWNINGVIRAESAEKAVQMALNNTLNF
ncbi:MAG: TIGR00725 family protein [Candidatus Aminicenantaceae bacterium]